MLLAEFFVVAIAIAIVVVVQKPLSMVELGKKTRRYWSHCQRQTLVVVVPLEEVQK